MIDETFTEWRPRLLRFCGQLLRNTHDAEEVVQDVFAKLLRQDGRYDLAKDPGVLLFRLARNRCIDLRRKLHPAATPDLDVAAREERPHLELAAALASLPFAEREVLLLTTVDGLGYREVKEILGCSLGTVAARRFTAIQKLQQRLSP